MKNFPPRHVSSHSFLCKRRKTYRKQRTLFSCKNNTFFLLTLSCLNTSQWAKITLNCTIVQFFNIFTLFQGSSSALLATLEKERELLRIFLRVSQMENTILRRMNLSSFLMVCGILTKERDKEFFKTFLISSAGTCPKGDQVPSIAFAVTKGHSGPS